MQFFIVRRYDVSLVQRLFLKILLITKQNIMKNVGIILLLAAAGCATAWLLTTKSGKKVLDVIKQKSDDLADDLKSGLNKVKDTTNDLVNKGKSYITDANDAIHSAM